jgi:hypothetical protein
LVHNSVDVINSPGTIITGAIGRQDSWKRRILGTGRQNIEGVFPQVKRTISELKGLSSEN